MFRGNIHFSPLSVYTLWQSRKLFIKLQEQWTVRDIHIQIGDDDDKLGAIITISENSQDADVSEDE